MFAKSIINSARFLRMPPTSRLLYYDLGMAADDDGIAEAFTVLRATGAAEDDLRVLAAKGFVSVLNDDLVTLINDWGKNNLIKSDRYHPSIYQELLVRLNSGTQMEPEVRLGKVSQELGEGKSGADKPPAPTPSRKKFVPPTLDEVTAYIRERKSRVDPQSFIDFYEAKGWLVGKSPMKD